MIGPNDDPGAVLDMCCGKKRCPILREISGVFVIEDEGQRIELTREQAEAAAAWLVMRLHRDK
jgi:hypothetical protein